MPNETQYTPESFQSLGNLCLGSAMIVVVGYIWLILGILMGIFLGGDEPPPLAILLLLMSFPCLFGGLICSGIVSLVLLYRCWGIIQTVKARTTPGMAVGLLFVPFFNLYWMFVVFVGLAEDMNYCADYYGIDVSNRINPILAIVTCIISLIPYVNFFNFIPACLLLFQCGKLGKMIQSRRLGIW